jgi:hypothetical protein
VPFEAAAHVIREYGQGHRSLGEEEKRLRQRAYQAIYDREHREEGRAYARTPARRARDAARSKERWAKTHPNYREQAAVLAAAREFEQHLIALRTAGRTWKEIGELLGRPWQSCRTTYCKVQKRVTPESAEALRRKTRENEARYRAKKRQQRGEAGHP